MEDHLSSFYLFLNIAQVCTSSSVSISTLVSSGVRESRILLLSDYVEGKLFKAITIALFLGPNQLSIACRMSMI